jgi:hypothetical protein
MYTYFFINKAFRIAVAEIIRTLFVNQEKVVFSNAARPSVGVVQP